MNNANPVVTDVVTAFQKVTTHGVKHSYRGDPHVRDMGQSHLQGIAYYNQFLLVPSNDIGYDHAFICVIDIVASKLVMTFDMPDQALNHAGGCQVVGDILVQPVESGGGHTSNVHFYNLTKLSDSQAPTVFDYYLARPSVGTGAAGMTVCSVNGTDCFLLAAYNDGDIDFYLSNGTDLTADGFEFTDWFSSSDTSKVPNDYSSVNLVTQADGRVYMIGFHTTQAGTGNDDLANLHEVDLDNRQLLPPAQRTDKDPGGTVHVFSDESGGVQGVDGVHFRWGGSIYFSFTGQPAVADNNFGFVASQRNSVGDLFFMNYFPAYSPPSGS